jgi:hypothetical protein
VNGHNSLSLFFLCLQTGHSPPRSGAFHAVWGTKKEETEKRPFTPFFSFLCVSHGLNVVHTFQCACIAWSVTHKENKEERIPPSLSLHFVCHHRLNFVHRGSGSQRLVCDHKEEKEIKAAPLLSLYTLCSHPDWTKFTAQRQPKAGQGETHKVKRKRSSTPQAKGTYYFPFSSFSRPAWTHKRN